MAHADAIDAIDHFAVMRALEIGRQRRGGALAIAAPEGLPREIIVRNVEVAGELFQAAFEHHRHLLVRGERVILRGGNAQSEQRCGLIGQPADKAHVENRRELFLEDRALLLDRFRFQHRARIDPVELRHQMRRADESAQQPALVYAPGKTIYPPPPGQIAAFPIAPRRFVKVRADIAAIGGDVGARIGLSEEAVECGVIGQMAGGGDLQFAQRDMRGVEIDRDDLRGISGKV